MDAQTTTTTGPTLEDLRQIAAGQQKLDANRMMINEHPCPACGHCPYCGRGGYQQGWPYYGRPAHWYSGPWC